MEEIKLISEPISLQELTIIAQDFFGDFVKAVVDVEKEIMAISGELHSDEEAVLLNLDSAQKNLWGINIYPLKSRDEWIEFDSIINLRPSAGNMSRNVEDENIQNKIRRIVGKLIL